MLPAVAINIKEKKIALDSFHHLLGPVKFEFNWREALNSFSLEGWC